MKKITLTLFLFGLSLAMGQTLPLDFSDPLDEFIDAGSVFSIVAGPVDMTNQVGEIVGGGGQFDNVQLTLPNFIDVSGTNQVITFRFWNPDADVMPGLFQLADSSDGSPAVEVPFTSNVSGAWQMITLNFANAGNAFPFCSGCPNDTAVALDKYSRIVIFTDFNATTTDTYFIDDIDGGTDGGAVPVNPVPQVAAPTPTTPAAEVISMFSNAYTNVAVDTWRTSWSNSSFADIQVAGNDTKEYTNLGFNGVETINGGSIDASNMNFFNMDVYSDNITAFRIKLVDFLGDGFQGGNGDTEAELTYTLTPNAWNTLSIPLTDFTAAGMTSFMDVSQLVISADPFGSANAYVDNVYYSINSTAGLDDLTAGSVKIYPNPSSNHWNISSTDQVIDRIEIFSSLGQKVIDVKGTEATYHIANTTLNSGVYFAKISSSKSSVTMKLVKK